MSAPSIGDIELCAWIDGESPSDRREAISRWLQANPKAATRAETWRRQNEIIRGRYARILAEPVPESIWPGSGAVDSPRAPAPRPFGVVGDRDAPIIAERFDRRRRDLRFRLAIVTAGSFLAGGIAAMIGVAAIGYAPALMTGIRVISAAPLTTVDTLLVRALDAHRTFVRDPGKPVEIIGEPAEIAAFLSKRVGLDIRPPDSPGDGLRLLGARVTPGDNGPAGLLVYEDARGDRFGLMIGRAPGAEGRAIQTIERRTSGLAIWFARGIGYVLTGPSDPARLTRLATSIAALEPAGSASRRQTAD